MEYQTNSEFLDSYDIVVAGAGFIGLSFAVSIKCLCPHISVLVMDRFDSRENSVLDERVFALTPSSLKMLKNIGVWKNIFAQIQPISRMYITDSSLEDFVRCPLLVFDEETLDQEVLAGVLDAHILHEALFIKAQELGVRIVFNHHVVDCAYKAGFLFVKCFDGAYIKTRLFVGADGADSSVRTIANIKTLNYQHAQSAIVCTVHHAFSHKGYAYQHFLPAGPFAILPMKGCSSSIVWTEGQEKAKRFIEGDSLVFKEELSLRFGLRLGEICSMSSPKLFSIRSMVAYNFFKERFVLIGDAAHCVHPLAGQGANIGLEDVAVLAELITQAYKLGQDIGSADVLENYESSRRPVAVRMLFATDLLNCLFSNDDQFWQRLRYLGLGIVDRSALIKQYFARQASGFWGNVEPEYALMRGNKIDLSDFHSS